MVDHLMVLCCWIFSSGHLKGLEKVYIEVCNHGVDSWQKAEQGGLWDQRLPSCQTQGAVIKANIFLCISFKVSVTMYINQKVYFASYKYCLSKGF